MRRLAATTSFLFVTTLVLPLAAHAHDQPESAKARWVMADWMLDTFFIFSGLALIAFMAAWKAGHFHDLDKLGALPLMIHEEDYYTPDWALDEEEWADGHA
jgi:hypothetical protein